MIIIFRFILHFHQHQLISVSVNGVEEILVEERDPEEVTNITGFADGKIQSVRICPENASCC